MTADQLQTVLNQLGVVRVGGGHVTACKVCQPDETDSECYKLQVNCGASYPVVLYCVRCCTPKPSTDAERLHNRQIARRNFALCGCDVELCYQRLPSDEIRRLWSQVKVGGATPKLDACERASDQLLHMAYEEMLSKLELGDRHRRWLSKRGLDPDHCFGIGYRTGRSDLRSLLRTDGVPGLAADGRWLLREGSLLIPCRTQDGLVASVKMRLTDGGRTRMRMLSGGAGPKANVVVHHPIGVTLDTDEPLWITESERAADYVHHHLQVPIVALSGVGFWSRAVLLGVESGSVVLAVDNDDAGRRCEKQLGQALASAGVEVQVARWTERKGIDDALAAGVKVEVVEWEDGGARDLVSSPPTKKSATNTFTKGQPLKDREVIPYLQQFGPVLRSEVNCYQPLISDLIRRGAVAMKKTSEGQMLEVVDAADAGV